MTKKYTARGQQAREARYLRKQFNGAFGKAKPELRMFLATGTLNEEKVQAKARVDAIKADEEAREKLIAMLAVREGSDIASRVLSTLLHEDGK